MQRNGKVKYLLGLILFNFSADKPILPRTVFQRKKVQVYPDWPE
jgi:hypothetical protein